jgi:4-amino-4-deoxy-L-arabinose transferase-like glycosyltransferase
LYLIGRRLVGTRAALCGALLLAVSPLHVMYSQLARYWSLVFLFSAIYPYAIFLGIRERSRGWLALGCVSAVLAVLAHPVSVLLLGGLVLYLVPGLRREHLARLWSQKGVRWSVVLALALAAAMLVRFVPLLQSWISVHDKNPGYGQFLRPPTPAPGLKQAIYLSIYAESLLVPVVLSAIAGIFWLWQERDRSLARFLTSLAVVHIGFLTLLSLRTSVSQYYLLPSAPLFYLGADLRRPTLPGGIPLRPRWLLPASC